MAKINPLDTDISYVSKLDDEPNDVGGLSAQELKAVFDKGGNVLKQYINDVVVNAINTMKANEVGFTRSTDIPADNVQGAVESVREQMKNATLGQIPDASIGAEKLTKELLDRSYTRTETNTLLDKKANESALDLVSEAVNTKASQNALNTTNDVLATKASKEEAQAIGYDGKLYQIMLDLDAPWVYLKGLSYGTNNYVVLRNGKYIAKLGVERQEFYNRETGALVATSAADLYDDSSYAYASFDFINYDDDIFHCYFSRANYFFNPSNGKFIARSEYYDGYMPLHYLGCSGGYMYYAFQNGSNLSITVKAVKLSTMEVDTSKTVIYNVTYAIPQVYHDMNAYAFAVSNGALCFETINLLTGTRKSQTITTVSSNALLGDVLWVDNDNSEIYLTARTTNPVITSNPGQELYLCKYNYATNTFSVLSKDFCCVGYAGHLDNDTVLLNQFKTVGVTDVEINYYHLLKFKLSTGEVLDSTEGKGESSSYQINHLYLFGGWRGRPLYHSGRFVALDSWLIDTKTMQFYGLRLKENAYVTNFLTNLSMSQTRYGPVLVHNGDYNYTPYEYFELDDRVGYMPIFAKEV